MAGFLWAVTAHAHTQDQLEFEPENDMKLRGKNKIGKARELATKVVDEIAKTIPRRNCRLEDVKLLVVCLSYRGDEKDDNRICDAVLETIMNKFKHLPLENRPRLIGHTTSGEFVNRDIELKKAEISGIGYNGLSLLALVSTLPIGVARSHERVNNREKAEECGYEMTKQAWNDYIQQESDPIRRERLRKMNKTLFVLTQGGKASLRQAKRSKSPRTGFEYFLAKGIVRFMNTNEAKKIGRVIGGSSGDGCIGTDFHQFYYNPRHGKKYKILEDEAVCALIPNLVEPKLGQEKIPPTKDVVSQDFSFNLSKEPKFMYIAQINSTSPPEKYAEIIYENETLLSETKEERGLSLEDLLDEIMELDGFPVTYPTLCKYALAFPYDNWKPVCPIRTILEDKNFELTHPVKGNTYQMRGKVVLGNAEKIRAGARNICNVLRDEEGFTANDAIILISCVSRRLVEIDANEDSETEAKIFKDEFFPSQVFGFLAYGEISIGPDRDPPWHYNFSCWGLRIQGAFEAERPPLEKPAFVGKKEPVSKKKYGTTETKRVGINRKGAYLKDERTSEQPLKEISEEADSEAVVSLKEGVHLKRKTRKTKRFLREDEQEEDPS